MPSVARCPNCTTELDVGDDIRRGESVECPVCLTRFVPDRPPPLPPPVEDRPARRDRDDEDDRDLDRPRRRRRRSGREYVLDKVSGPAGGLMAIGWIGIVLGGLNVAPGGLLVMMALAAPPGGGAGGGPGGGAAGPQQTDFVLQAVLNLASGLWSVVVGVLILYRARR